MISKVDNITGERIVAIRHTVTLCVQDTVHNRMTNKVSFRVNMPVRSSVYQQLFTQVQEAADEST